ncbi:MAG: iron ABC transporter permease, partial [Spirochaetaceae bacterium]|nr:iron ABC transporter permease [Spirochaetaceae bacterium]
MLKTSVVSHRFILFLFLVFCVIIVFFLNVGFGSAKIGLHEILSIISGGTEAKNADAIIIQKIRLPRALAAIAAGAALAVSGLLLQTFFNNPIVEPYVLGISSGSALFVGLSILGGMRFGLSGIHPIVMFCGAFLGATLIMLIMLF